MEDRREGKPSCRSLLCLITKLLQHTHDTSVSEINPDTVHQPQGGGIALTNLGYTVFCGQRNLAAKPAGDGLGHSVKLSSRIGEYLGTDADLLFNQIQDCFCIIAQCSHIMGPAFRSNLQNPKTATLCSVITVQRFRMRLK